MLLDIAMFCSLLLLDSILLNEYYDYISRSWVYYYEWQFLFILSEKASGNTYSLMRGIRDESWISMQMFRMVCMDFRMEGGGRSKGTSKCF